MIKLRERSHIFLWILLFFFVASMTVGGLVGGANVLDVILGRKNTNLYVGKVDGKGITRRAYEIERNIKLTPYNQSNIPVTDQVIINAGNQAWNSLIERSLKDKKIESLELISYGDEIYNFLLLTPPIFFQEDLKESGLFTDEEGNFNVELYQEAARSGQIPEDVKPILQLWENYIKTWLADRKLGSLYRTLGSINDNEVHYQYTKDSLICDIDYLYVNINSIPDSLFDVSNKEILVKYNKIKDEVYASSPTRKIEYVLWSYPAISALSDTLDNFSAYTVKDSLEDVAWLFADEARYSSFKEAVDIYEVEAVVDTIDIALDFSAQGIPRNIRPGRSMVRFAFDNSVGKVSEPINLKDGLIAVIHIILKNSNKYKPLDEVKEKIKRDILKDKKIDYARETIFSDIDFNLSWDKISNSNDAINLIKNETNTIAGRFKELGSSDELVGTLMGLSPGEVSGVIEMRELSPKSFVVKLNNKDEVDEEKYLESYESIKNQLLSQRNSRAFTDWLEYNKESISSQDWRKDIY